MCRVDRRSRCCDYEVDHWNSVNLLMSCFDYSECPSERIDINRRPALIEIDDYVGFVGKASVGHHPDA
jgi:hypothetical protein